MKTKIRNFIIALTAVIFLFGCSDFLNVENKSTLNTDNFPATKEQCQLLLNSCYASPHFNGLYNYYWFPMGIYLHDHTSDLFGAWGDRLSAQENNTNVKMEELEDMYVDIFKTIGFANMAIDGVEHYSPRAPESEQADLSYIKGQALFFRAFGYWHGQIFFDADPVNGRSLPIFRSIINDIKDMEATPATTGDMWKFMIEDLQESARLLAGHNDNKYLVSEWAAKGLLAKVYMQAAGKTNANGYWEKARDVMKDIIDNSGKTLAPFDDYKRMFNGAPNEYEFGCESLFEIDMVTNPNQQGPYYGTFTMGGGMPMVFAPTFLKLDKAKKVTDYKPTINAENGEYVNPNEKISLRSAWENNYIHDVNIRRFGFTGDPTPLLELNPNFIWANEMTIHNFPYRMIDSAAYVQNSLNARNLSDPRLGLCAAQPWVDTAIDDNGRTTLYGRAPAIGSTDREYVLGWWHKKFTNLNGTEAASSAAPEHGKYCSSDANIPFIRLADIYLLYAEVLQNLGGNDAEALKYVNAVHRRAYGGSGDPAASDAGLDYTSLNQRTKTVAPDDELANDVIKYERWAELFAEGQWWWDVRRWQIGAEETNCYKTATMGTTTLVYNPATYYTQPIPQAELDRNSAYKSKARGW